MSLKNLSAIAANNTLTPPFGAPESSTKLKDYNDCWRYLASVVRHGASSNTIASAATCDLGSLDEAWLTVSGITTITSFGTVSAGIYKLVTFSGALTLTHNATSLILLGGANRTTVAGDCGLYVSLGGGNWKEYFYSPISTSLASLTTQQATDIKSLSTFMGTLLNDADATEARATLGAEPTLLIDYTVPAVTTSVTFSGIGVVAHRGYHVEVDYGDGANATHQVSMYVNGLTIPTDYFTQYIHADGATLSATRDNSAGIFAVDINNRTKAGIDIYGLDTFLMATSVVARTVGAGLKTTIYSWSRAVGTSDITSLTFSASVANGIAAGSRFRIYRKDR